MKLVLVTKDSKVIGEIDLDQYLPTSHTKNTQDMLLLEILQLIHRGKRMGPS